MKELGRMALALAAILALVVLGTAPVAHAGFKLELDNLSTVGVDLLIEDNDPNDLNPTVGKIAFIGEIGQFEVDFVGGLSKPHPDNSAHKAFMDLLNLTVRNNTSGSRQFQIRLTDTDFNLIPGPTNSAFLTSSIGGTLTSGESVEAWQYADLGNAEFGIPGTASVHHGVLSGSPFADKQQMQFSYSGGNFSVTEVALLTFTGSGAISFDMSSTVVTPEPGTMAIWAVGLAMAGTVRRLRRRNRTAA